MFDLDQINELSSVVLASLQDIISALFTDKERQKLNELPEKLIILIKSGNFAGFADLINESKKFLGTDSYLYSWLPIIQSFVNVYPSLTKEPDRINMIGFAKICDNCARLLEDFQQPAAAYNFYEWAYLVYESLEADCQNTVEKVLELSDPNNINQYRAALWRVAIQQVLKSNKEKTNYLSALDLTETALNAPCPNEMLQEYLEGILRDALLRSETPLANLAVILLMLSNSPVLQYSQKAIASNIAQGEDMANKDKLNAAIQATIIQHQTAIDDYRLELLGFPKLKSGITLDDQTLIHADLKAAVPVGRSLILDVNRTGKLLLDLSHEVTHAFSLLGNIGNQRMALRAATHFCEMFNKAYDPNPNTDKSLGSPPLEKLSNDELVGKMAEIQLSIMYRTTVLEATWRPWLEGVAVYFEMLSDPKKDPFEITPVFEALRGLVGVWLSQEKDETLQQYSKRFEKEAVDKYEDFHSKALEKFGEDIHLQYLLLQFSKTDKSNAADVYIMGYILIRSLVSRWEHTLNTRLEPVIAAKLLLFLTRFSTMDYLPQLTAAADNLEANSQAMFMAWLDTIAGISEKELKMFFTNVEKNEPGRNYSWDNSHIVPAEDKKKMETLVYEIEQQTRKQIDTLLTGHPSDRFFYSDDNNVLSAVVNEQDITIDSLFSRYNTYLTLLPLGHDDSRIIVPANTGSFFLFTRTHIGYEKQDNNNRNSNPKYSIQRHPFPGGIDEREKINELCAQYRTGRVQATQVIDFVGGTDSPIKVPNQSAVCYFLGKDWHLISLLHPHVEHISDEYKPFISLLHDRIFRPGFFSNEHDTLSSLTFLQKRFHAAGFQSPFSEKAHFDQASFSSRIALEACNKALGIEPSELSEAFLSIDGKTSVLVSIAGFLNDSGKGKNVQVGMDKLSSLLFDTKSPSFIKPFKI